MTLPILLSLLLPAGAAEVTLDLEQYLVLRGPDAPAPEQPPPPMVTDRAVRVTPRGEALGIRASWTVVAPDPGWVDLRLAGRAVEVAEVRVDGRVASVISDEQGAHLVLDARGRHRIELDGELPQRQGSTPLELLPAGAGDVEVPDGLVVVGGVPLGGRRFAAPGGALELVPAPPPRASGRSTLVIASAGVGMTVGDGDLRTRVRLRLGVAQGELSRVSVDLPGAGPDLVVQGPQIASWKRSGDRVDIELLGPEKSLVTLEAGWSGPLPAGEASRVPVPAVRVDGVFRTDVALQVARDGEVDVIPEVPGLTATAAEALPEWGRGLVEGTPTSAFTGRAAGGSLGLFRFVPADAPATLVDVASYTIATTDEGRVLMQARYAVRNDRGAALRVTAPPGLRPIGARVGGDTARVARDGDAWLVPLQKSVETVQGLVSFPVEVVFLGEAGAWDRRERRAMRLPTVDADVAASRVTLYLPPGYRSKGDPDHGDRVLAFSEGQGITYGFAAGDARALAADALFQEAVDAWMSNEWEQAQGLLDRLGSMGAANDDIGRLQSNLDLVSGDKKDTGGDVVLERRVKEQAKARAQQEVVEQKEILEEAENRYASGDYSGAEEAYKQALDIGKKLEALSNEEDVSQSVGNAAVAGKLAASSSKRKEKNVEPIEPFTTDDAEEYYDLGQPLTKEFLEKIPAGRTYQSAVQTASGQTGERDDRNAAPADANGPLGGDSFGGEVTIENGYVLDGVSISDEPAEERLRGEAEQAARAAAEQAARVEAERRALAEADRRSNAAEAAAVTDGDDEDRQRVVIEAQRIEIRESPIVAEPPPPPDTGAAPPKSVAKAPSMSISRGGKGGAKAAPRPEEPLPASTPSTSIQLMPEADAPPVVTASALSVVVPAQGEAVRYQHLLLPAGATWDLPVDARRTRRNR